MKKQKRKPNRERWEIEWDKGIGTILAKETAVGGLSFPFTMNDYAKQVIRALIDEKILEFTRRHNLTVLAPEKIEGVVGEQKRVINECVYKLECIIKDATVYRKKLKSKI